MEFYKYQGTGNDFIMIDDRTELFDSNDQRLIEHLCDRRFGIGADGLILLRNDTAYDFKMIYFNADGRASSMCGNGGRCIVAFAKFLNIIQHTTTFTAVDGIHEAKIENDIIHLKMNEVEHIRNEQQHFILFTGSPHYVKQVENIDLIDVYKEGNAIRYSNEFKEEGINVNFIELIDAQYFKIRTYERGVEDETFSCGTGVVASSIVSSIIHNKNNTQFKISTKGGDLQVQFEQHKNKYKNIWLIGPAMQVFKGYIN
ncbi:MAG: diaminopimelate epimerase [Bacteroidota bacterium]